MASEIILYGPASEPYNTYAAVSPAPGNNGAGGDIALRGVRPLGTQLVLQDGRKFRFALAGASALVVADVIQSAAVISTDVDMTPAAGSVGDRIITFTHGAATVVINYFAEGFVFITITPGFGDNYKVASHAALQNATAGDIVNLAPGHALRRAITTTTRITLAANKYAGVVQAAATLTGVPVGVAVAAIPASNFGWLQTRGEAAVKGAGTLVIGSRVSALVSGGTAGAVAPNPTSTSGALMPNVGMVLNVEATTQASLIDLRMDG